MICDVMKCLHKGNIYCIHNIHHLYQRQSTGEQRSWAVAMRKSACALSTAGQTLAKIGLKVNLSDPLAEKFARNRSLMNLFDKVRSR